MLQRRHIEVDVSDDSVGLIIAIGPVRRRA